MSADVKWAFLFSVGLLIVYAPNHRTFTAAQENVVHMSIGATRSSYLSTTIKSERSAECL